MPATTKTCRSGTHQFTGRRCGECAKSRMAKYRAENKDAIRESNAAYKASHKEEQRSYGAKWAADNRVRKAKYDVQYRKANAEKRRESRRAYYEKNSEVETDRRRVRYTENLERESRVAADWRKANPDKVCAMAAARRATKLRATPVWADRAKIEEFYYTATMLGMHTGEAYHVDHIVPLRGKNVCGLHWEGNLQILSAKENMRKGNRL